MTHVEIQDRIRAAIIKWTPDIQALCNQEQIIAINFGLQKVWDGFELYLSGHSWYDDHDIWLFGGDWSPKQNYISLGEDSLEFDRQEMLGMYEKIVEDEIKVKKELYSKLEIVVVGLNPEEPKRLK